MILVSLSNGESFYVDAEMVQVAGRLYHDHRRENGFVNRLVYIGNRFVNPLQVVQLQHVREVPSIYTPETLED